MKDHEEDFVHKLVQKCSVLLFKCHYQKWQLSWKIRTWMIRQKAG